MNHALCWRAFCWFEGIPYKSTYGGALWLHYYRIYKHLYSRDTDAEMRALSA